MANTSKITLKSKAEKKFLTLAELSTRWEIPKPTLYEWLQNGRLPFATKLGKNWRFKITAVESYEKKQEVGTR